MREAIDYPTSHARKCFGRQCALRVVLRRGIAEIARAPIARGLRRISGGTPDVLDNRSLHHTKYPMTGPDQPNLPQGYVQLTEGRIRTTDLVYGKTSSGWSEPHAFVVGSAVGEDGTRVARRMPAEPKSRSRG